MEITTFFTVRANESKTRLMLDSESSVKIKVRSPKTHFETLLPSAVIYN